nr:MAG TPA: hypothetical protein [Caudoviricetes sp.]
MYQKKDYQIKSDSLFLRTDLGEITILRIGG